MPIFFQLKFFLFLSFYSRLQYLPLSLLLRVHCAADKETQLEFTTSQPPNTRQMRQYHPVQLSCFCLLNKEASRTVESERSAFRPFVCVPLCLLYLDKKFSFNFLLLFFQFCFIIQTNNKKKQKTL